ncbi:MAG: Protease 3 [Candidatus Erwinia impunctatus]|nr:Protease 3 [Culicoides impunctatus]
MRHYFSYIIMLLLLLTSGRVTAADNAGWQPVEQLIRKSEQDPRHYQAITLSNGMNVLLVSDPQATKSLAALTIPIGSLDNPTQQQGLAHYLEHMVLMGSVRYPQPDALAGFLKKHGGNHNASTASYRTSFYLEVENDALEPALARLADAIAAPSLDPLYADRERHAVNAELTMARSRDGLRMGQVTAETLNPSHPGALFFGGNLETLSDKPGSQLHQSLVDFYQRYYSANLMKAVIYSNASLAEMKLMAVKTWGRVANRHTLLPEIGVPVVTDKERGIMIHYVPAQPHKQLKIDFIIDNNSSQFRSKTDTLISYMLNNRTKNTLSDWLQQQGLAEGISAGADPMLYRNSGVFTISVSLKDKGLAERDRVIAAVFSYLQLLKSAGIDKRYFDEMGRVLNIDYRYPSITRDMNYIQWLADMLLRVPVEHVLDAPYLADDYNPAAIARRLSEMTPEAARIWVISPNEPHNKRAYFVDAPYQMEKITAAEFEQWQQLAGKVALSLPTPNPYIADDFTLVTQPAKALLPETLVDQPGFRVRYTPSQLFADEPKAMLTLTLRNPQTMSNAKNQVLYSLNDYLAALATDALRSQASIAGVNFSTTENGGVTFTLSGFTQYLPTLTEALLRDYANYQTDEQQLAQAKAWYLERLDAAERGKAFEQALQPAQLVSQLPYIQRRERRAVIPDITLADLKRYRLMLLQEATPDLLVVGNMAPGSVKKLAQSLKNITGSQGKRFWYGDDVVIDKKIAADFQRAASSTDSALAALYVPLNENEYQGMAKSMLLSQIIQPWFYNQLRTEEQLGYAVFTFPGTVGRQWGIGFLLQSNVKQPAALLARFQAFYPVAEARLQALKEEEFSQYQRALINDLEQRPQTAEEEAGRLNRDFDRGNLQFDSREKLIASLRQLTLPDLQRFFQQAVMKPDGLTLLSQIAGSQHDAKDYALPEGFTTWSDISAFQRTLSVKNIEP